MPPLDEPAALDRLRRGSMELLQRIPWSSNATFLAELTTDVPPAPEDEALIVVYKPRRGERALWDFRSGTLCARELAAYEVSVASGWDIVPPTVLRDGPYGFGMVQLFVDHDPDDHFLELREGFSDRFREFAAFDVVINNADRKSGHCLLDADGHVWGIDHGVTFHAHHKLRTVIWDYAGQPLPGSVTDGLCRIERELAGELGDRLASLLSPEEAFATRSRVERLLETQTFPEPVGDYPFPWPLV